MCVCGGGGGGVLVALCQVLPHCHECGGGGGGCVPHVTQVMSRVCRPDESYIFCDLYILCARSIHSAAVEQFEEVKKKYIEEYRNVSGQHPTLVGLLSDTISSHCGWMVQCVLVAQ